MPDRLLLHGMVFFGRHGALAAERELGARFGVDVELTRDLAAAGRSDRLDDTTDYGAVYGLVRQVVEGPPCNLLEAVAERIASAVLELPGAASVTVRVRKRPPLEGEFASFAVEITRGARP